MRPCYPRTYYVNFRTVTHGVKNQVYTLSPALVSVFPSLFLTYLVDAKVAPSCGGARRRHACLTVFP
jgi:hypothetical protein